MNPKTMIFSGIMTALVGAMIALAVAHIGHRQARPRVIGGAILGFVIGAAQDGVRQQSKIRNSENLEQNLDQGKDI